MPWLEGQRRDILSLPDELLCMVFTVVAFMDHPASIYGYYHISKKRPKRGQRLGFLQLSEVCTRFRALLLSMSNLWASVVFTLPIEAGKLALARSGSAPLPMELYPSYRLRKQDRNAPDLMRDHVLALAKENAARMCSLTAKSLSFTHHDQLFSGPLPQLKELDMVYDSSAELPQSSKQIWVNVPALQHARFQFFEMDCFYLFERCYNFNTPSLRSLEIDVSDWSTENVLTLRWIVDLLRNSPLLSSLKLTLSLYSTVADWEAAFSNRPIQLPHLQVLELVGTTANMPCLFRNIGSPQVARCVARTNWVSKNVDDNALAMDFANTFSPLLRRPSYDSLAVEVVVNADYHPVLTFCMVPTLGGSNAHAGANFVEVSIGFALPIDTTVHSKVAEAFVKALQGNRIRELSITSPGIEAWPSALQSILSICSAVEHLTIRHDFDDEYNTPDFLIPAEPNILPVLDTMSLEFVDNSESSMEDISSCWAECLTWLEGKARAGQRVRRLRVTGRLRITGQDDEHKEMYARAAEFVDEFVDDRVHEDLGDTGYRDFSSSGNEWSTDVSSRDSESLGESDHDDWLSDNLGSEATG